MSTNHLIYLYAKADTISWASNSVIVPHFLFFSIHIINLGEEAIVLIGTNKKVTFTTFMIATGIYYE